MRGAAKRALGGGRAGNQPREREVARKQASRRVRIQRGAPAEEGGKARRRRDGARGRVHNTRRSRPPLAQPQLHAGWAKLDPALLRAGQFAAGALDDARLSRACHPRDGGLLQNSAREEATQRDGPDALRRALQLQQHDPGLRVRASVGGPAHHVRSCRDSHLRDESRVRHRRRVRQ